MDKAEAGGLIAQRDVEDRSERVTRLIELDRLTGKTESEGYLGEAGLLLFEDVKATWIYGFFTSTIITAAAFCRIQLAGALRLLPGVQQVPTDVSDLEGLASLATQRGLIQVETQASLIQLHDRASAYEAGDLGSFERRLEQHIQEAQSVSAQHPLWSDALMALEACVRMVYR